MTRFLLCAILFTGAALSPDVASANDRKICDTTYGLPAIAACTRLIESRRLTTSDRAITTSIRGLRYFLNGQYEKAIADQDQALSIMKHWTFYNNRGLAYDGLQQFDLAIEDYSAAIKMDPSQQLAYANRAVAWQRKGNQDRSLQDLDKAVQLAPKDFNSRTSRGVVRINKGDLDGALADLDAAIKMQPNHPRAYESRAAIFRTRGDLDRALADMDRAIEFNPRLPSSRVLRGLVYESRNDIERAKADYKIAIALPSLSNEGNFSTNHTGLQETAKIRLRVLEDTANTPPAALLPESKPSPAVQSAPNPDKRDVGRRIALVIGNGAYAGIQPLLNPVNDARLVAKNLRAIGFEVMDGINLNRDGMKKTVNEFLRNAATAKISMVFYAGHGMQIDGKNYLVAVDSDFSKSSDIAAEMTDIDYILNGLNDNIRTNIIVLDACRDNPLAQKAAQVASATRSVTVRSGLAAPSGLNAGVTVGAGTLLAFATAPGQVALDGDSDNSPFSSALARHISTPGLEVQQMLTRVRTEVVAATKNKQVPWSNSSLLGEVYLVGEKP